MCFSLPSGQVNTPWCGSLGPVFLLSSRLSIPLLPPSLLYQRMLLLLRQNTWRENLKNGGVRVQSGMAGKADSSSVRQLGPTASAVGRQRGEGWCQLAFFCFSEPAHRMVPPTFGQCLPCSVNPEVCLPGDSKSIQVRGADAPHTNGARMGLPGNGTLRKPCPLLSARVCRLNGGPEG